MACGGEGNTLELINELVINSSQTKVLLDTSVGITYFLDSYYKVKITGTN